MRKEPFRRVIVSLFVAALLCSAGYHLFFRPTDDAVMAFRPGQPSGFTVVIDAGHGGEDGGAVSPSGTVESEINLAIAMRLDALLGLCGVEAKRLRSEDISLHDASADTLREKKRSDLKNRVTAIESTENAIVLSIHQNIFSGSNSSGAQVFYADDAYSRMLALHTQETLRLALNPDNHRHAARVSETVYLMNHITCPAVLVECGFLSHPGEGALLGTDVYQLKVAAAIAASYLSFDPSLAEEGDLHTNES